MNVFESASVAVRAPTVSCLRTVLASKRLFTRSSCFGSTPSWASFASSSRAFFSRVSKVTPGFGRSVIENSPASSRPRLFARTSLASCSSILRALSRIAELFAARMLPRTSSAASSEAWAGAEGQVRLSSGSLTLSSMTRRFSAASFVGRGVGVSTAGPRGIEPKYFRTRATTSSAFTSPPTASVALFGPYQRWKKALTSSRLAALKSSCEPIVIQL